MKMTLLRGRVINDAMMRVGDDRRRKAWDMAGHGHGGRSWSALSLSVFLFFYLVGLTGSHKVRSFSTVTWLHTIVTSKHELAYRTFSCTKAVKDLQSNKRTFPFWKSMAFSTYIGIQYKQKKSYSLGISMTYIHTLGIDTNLRSYIHRISVQ